MKARTARVLTRTAIGAVSEALAHRRAFWLAWWSMMANNLIWVIVWTFFFDEVGTVRGWGGDEVRLLLAIFATSAGIVLGLLNNVRNLAVAAFNGELDAALALPVPTLPYLLVRRARASGMADIGFGVLLFAIAGQPSWPRVGAYVFGVICSTGVLVGFLILVGSIGIRASSRDAGELGFQSITLFAFYPVDLFSPTARFFLYFVVPAGFVSSLPTRLVAEFTPALAGAEVAASAVALSIGVAAFRNALRHRTSGAGWTSA